MEIFLKINVFLFGIVKKKAYLYIKIEHSPKGDTCAVVKYYTYAQGVALWPLTSSII